MDFWCILISWFVYDVCWTSDLIWVKIDNEAFGLKSISSGRVRFGLFFFHSFSSSLQNKELLDSMLELSSHIHVQSGIYTHTSQALPERYVLEPTHHNWWLPTKIDKSGNSQKWKEQKKTRKRNFTIYKKKETIVSSSWWIL